MISKAKILHVVRVRAKALKNNIEKFAVGEVTELEKDIDSNTKFFLTTLENKQLISLQPKSLLMIKLSFSDKDDDEVSIFKVT